LGRVLLGTKWRGDQDNEQIRSVEIETMNRYRCVAIETRNRYRCMAIETRKIKVRGDPDRSRQSRR